VMLTLRRVHHAPTQHHGLSALPMKTLDEFKASGGAISGNKGPTHEEYEGAPRPYNDKLATTFDKLEEKFHVGSNRTHGTTTTVNGGMNGSNHHSNGATTTTTTTGDVMGANRPHRHTDSGVGGVGSDMSTHDKDSHIGTKKPSLMDRLNPRVDADGDGKRGLMD
jgi:hypothetical protein